MAHYAKLSTDAVKNFLASEVGLRLVTHQFSNSGLSADSNGKKIIRAGSIVGSGANAVGIVFNDVDVTDGDHEGAMMVGGFVINDQLPTAASSDEKTALKAIGIGFKDNADKVSRKGITLKTFDAGISTNDGTKTFDADDIAEHGDGLTLIITAVESSDTAKATVAVASGNVTVTAVANGDAVITCTLTDSLGSTYSAAIDCAVSNQS